MPTHGHESTTHGKTKNTNKLKNTLKQIIFRCCFHFTIISSLQVWGPNLQVFLGFFPKPPDLHVMGVGRSAVQSHYFSVWSLPRVCSQNVKLPSTSSSFAWYKRTVEPPLRTSSLQLLLVLVPDYYVNLPKAVTTPQWQWPQKSDPIIAKITTWQGPVNQWLTNGVYKNSVFSLLKVTRLDLYWSHYAHFH